MDNTAKKPTLSDYATKLSHYMWFHIEQKPFEKVACDLRMLKYAFILYLNEKDLGHRELNVLLSYLLQIGNTKILYPVLYRMSQRALILASKSLPHDKALTYLNRATVLLMKNKKDSWLAEDLVCRALKLKSENKKPTPRQLIIFYYKSSLLLHKLGRKSEAIDYCSKAHELAEKANETKLATLIFRSYQKIDRRSAYEDDFDKNFFS